MKKKLITIVSIILVLGLATGGAYFIDKKCMDNNKPVIFSTWGYDYAPLIEHEDITEKVPNISEINTTENITTASIEINENETIFIELLDGWKYEVSGDSTERYDYAIKFFTTDSNKKMTLYKYKNGFSTCGTGLDVKDIILDDGNVVSAGFYDGSELWTFINFGNNIVMQNEGLTLEESNEVLSMIKTIKFVKTHPGNIVDFNRDNEKVKIEVLTDTVTRNGATVIITDKNENPYGWGKSYKLQQKIADEWYNMAPHTEMIFEEIGYILNSNGQYTENIDWTRFYGELGNGTFRIVKDTYDKGYINFYSNEFVIK